MKILKINIFTYIYLIFLCLSASFKEVLLLILILSIHELGHISIMKLYKIKINNITIYPFGGIISCTKLINYPPIKELLISSMGIINQLILYLIFIILFNNNIINLYTYTIFLKLNTSLIIFNILPIIPLDGSTIINSILNIFIPYLISNNLKVIISIITIIIFITISYKLKLNIIIILSFLLIKLKKYLSTKKYLENKFLLERVLYKLPYSKIKYNKDYSKYKLYLNTYHYFNYIKEETYLKRIYKL